MVAPLLMLPDNWRRVMRFTLHVRFSSGLKLTLHEDAQVELWTTDHYVLGVLSGKTIRQLVEHHLSTAALQAYIEEEIKHPPNPMPEEPPPKSLPPPWELTKQRGVALRARRRSRRKR